MNIKIACFLNVTFLNEENSVEQKCTKKKKKA